MGFLNKIGNWIAANFWYIVGALVVVAVGLSAGLLIAQGFQVAVVTVAAVVAAWFLYYRVTRAARFSTRLPGIKAFENETGKVLATALLVCIALWALWLLFSKDFLLDGKILGFIVGVALIGVGLLFSLRAKGSKAKAPITGRAKFIGLILGLAGLGVLSLLSPLHPPVQSAPTTASIYADTHLNIGVDAQIARTYTHAATVSTSCHLAENSIGAVTVKVDGDGACTVTVDTTGSFTTLIYTTQGLSAAGSGRQLVFKLNPAFAGKYEAGVYVTRSKDGKRIPMDPKKFWFAFPS